MAQSTHPEVTWRYGDPRSHEAVSTLIRRHSTNIRDVRDAILQDVDLSSAVEVLDLGCGFGFMAQAIARLLPTEGRITGIDALRANRVPFEWRVRTEGRRAKFVRMTVDRRLPWRDRSYDLVVSTYSLYFFPQALPEIARVLRPGGRFLTVTHSAESLRNMLRLAGIPEVRAPLLTTVQRFCSENGSEILSRCFATVEPIDYQNSLRFDPEEIDSLLRYLRFKFRCFNEWPESEPELCELESRELRQRLCAMDEIVLEKNDTAFWCSEPRWGPGMPGYAEWLDLENAAAGHWGL
jgi:ubiquinone/menaquinone biosynthesis C-methylase UbiE